MALWYYDPERKTMDRYSGVDPILGDTQPDTLLSAYEQFVDMNWTGGTPEYTMIALAGEVGEACNMHKKGMRDPGMGHDPNWKKKKLDELGDTLYYLVRACHEEGTTLRNVMIANEKKLKAGAKHSVPGH
jgi:NTP pyrophosphatase (non-canonical NTP hydrolase)